jgi:hypothetical protein
MFLYLFNGGERYFDNTSSCFSYLLIIKAINYTTAERRPKMLCQSMSKYTSQLPQIATVNPTQRIITLATA